MAATNDEILAVLNAVVRYLSIDLPCQPLSPDAQMGREDLLQKVENLSNKITNDGSKAPEEISNLPTGIDPQSFLDKRCSSYVDMAGLQPEIDAHMDEIYDDVLQSQEKPLEKNSQESQDLEENYEIADIKTEDQPVIELKEEDENEEDYEVALPANRTSNGSGSGSNEEVDAQVENSSELTEAELLEKLKKLGNTSPKIVCQGSICSGYMMKQKKKMLSKWNKRYCIVKDCFMFYYKTENDSKSLGVIVLPGYQIQEESKSKFIFKLTPCNKGRSTYLFQLSSDTALGKWLKVLSPICSQKLNRLKSDVFNRIAKHLDDKSENDEGSAGEPVKFTALEEEEGDMYEPIPDEGLHSTITSSNNQTQSSSFEGEIYDDVAAVQELAEEDELYDDHVGSNVDVPKIPQPVAISSDELYEGIPGESYEPEPSTVEPIQEDIYEEVPGAMALPPPRQTVAPIPPQTPPPVIAANIPTLPSRTPVLPPRGAAPIRPGNEEVPLPPSIPSRKPVADEPTELIEEEPEDEEPAGPKESDFSYDNVYIGTSNQQPSEADELTFNRGDLIYILNKINEHWWVGCLNDKVGLVQSDVLIAGFAH